MDNIFDQQLALCIYRIYVVSFNHVYCLPYKLGQNLIHKQKKKKKCQKTFQSDLCECNPYCFIPNIFK